jgi:Icc-related predicted phosphoesterase
VKILSLSDTLVQIIYSPRVRQRFGDVDLVIGCGDLPYYYQEYVISMLDKPLFFVRGNHDKEIEYHKAGNRSAPRGGIDLHRKVINHNGLILAGVEGSLRYRKGPFQYSQFEMWLHVIRLLPKFFYNRLRHGRYLDVFVTHAPPRDIHDKPDLTHQGIDAFLWVIRVFQPIYHLHGHIHVYRPDEVTLSRIGRTQVINTYGFRTIDLNNQR